MGKEVLTMEECLQMAARAWCQPETSNKVMDPLLAVAFAQIIYDYANGTTESYETEPCPNCKGAGQCREHNSGDGDTCGFKVRREARELIKSVRARKDKESGIP